MCGIAGTIDAMADRAAARVSQLNDAQKHRGPDHEVITRVGGITLGDTLRPRSGPDLVLLQRELFPASLMSELTGVGSDRMARPLDAAAWPAGSVPGSFATMVAAEVAICLQAMLLSDADTFSIASSVELRVPFVDRHVFSAALQCGRSRNGAPGKAAIGAALRRS